MRFFDLGFRQLRTPRELLVYLVDPLVQRIVKDRLAITGARWSLPGAEAVLLLRAVITNGDFPAYWKFHLQQEHHRTHTSRYQHQYNLAA